MAGRAGSLVAAVLEHSGQLDKEHLGAHVGRLSRRVEELKEEVWTMMNSKYSEFLPSVQNREDLVAEVEGLCMDIDLLKAAIENEVQQDLNVAVTEFTELKQQLERDSVVLSVLKKLQEFDTAVKEFSTALLEERYMRAAQRLEKARSSLRNVESHRGFELRIPKALRKELTVQEQSIIYQLGKEWQKLIVWKLPHSKGSSSLEAVVLSELHLHAVPPQGEDTAVPAVAAVLQALAVMGELHYKLKDFGQLLMEYILKPLISYPSLEPVTEEQPDVFILRFRSQEPALDEFSPIKVFDKIKLIFEVLHKYLLNVPLEEPGKGGKDGRVTLAELLGELIWEELSNCLIHSCLVHSLPTSSSQLEQYKEVIESTKEFEKALKEMQFLKQDKTALLKYACNVNFHFANKKCQDLIKAARKLMTSEIHNTVKITPDSSAALPELPAPWSGDHPKTHGPSNLLDSGTVNLGSESSLSQSTLSLPTCRISSSVQQLMELAYNTMEEAKTSTKFCCLQLCNCVRDIFHVFCEVVPKYHRENLQKLPQLAAIHYNNCMYIVHHLLTLGHQFRYLTGAVLSDCGGTFVDMVPDFRKLGMECFLAQMQVQKRGVLDRLWSARNFSNMDDDENYRAANKSIKQVLHQLRGLGTVWQDVLPVHVYCKAMGTLLNTALAEIVTRITALEDISAEGADRLYSLCKIMVDEGPQVFTPLLEEDKNKKYQEEVPVYVQKWMTFRELMIILRANLQEIVDRWADGKGPLAEQFSAAEVKSLIRALFQNTERRAAALAKIK
ncbi:centromere/kinetochore protein zw10 homolog [Corvus kubaryi]|uniref:Centromere/kinetochore protein zw10 homolog n=1 Tax=Corvus moneduloides TaxID=1196302 RepID=A0A8C3ES01_CORMO|nr:centromere/kinetochore protein zw10 homolog [Corvus moneduloides]XP_041890116.1 centromere/kinetochore protein zw10 homolog [Corvus kubaryi]